METKEPGYLRQLDGLRALSVAAVAWSHWRAYWNHNPSFFPGAELGVETFFVIAVFLLQESCWTTVRWNCGRRC